MPDAFLSIVACASATISASTVDNIATISALGIGVVPSNHSISNSSIVLPLKVTPALGFILCIALVILSNNIIENVEAGQKMSLSDVSIAETQWRKIYKGFEVFFEDIDLLIVPGNATPAFRIEDGIPREINGKKMENYMDASLIRSALTLTGHPVLALPCGSDYFGLPFGLQLVGKRRGDIDLLEISLALEGVFSRNPDLKRSIPDL